MEEKEVSYIMVELQERYWYATNERDLAHPRIRQVAIVKRI